MNPAFRIIKPPQLPDTDPERLALLQQVSAISLRAHQRNIEAKFKNPIQRRAIEQLRNFTRERFDDLTAAQFATGNVRPFNITTIQSP